MWRETDRRKRAQERGGERWGGGERERQGDMWRERDRDIVREIWRERQRLRRDTFKSESRCDHSLSLSLFSL